MPPAGRVGDQTAHPGVITGPGVATVLIQGQPASVVGDIHTCAFPPPAPHPPTPMAMGSTSVMFGGRPAIRLGDSSGCGAPVIVGCFTVIIGG